MAKKRKKETVSDLEGKTVDVQRGYKHLVNCGSHGGEKYETIEFSSVRTARDIPTEEAEAVSKSLHLACKDEVDSTIKAYDEMLAGELGMEDVEAGEEVPKKKKKRKKKDDIGIDKDELADIKDLLNGLIDAEDVDEMKEVGEEIEERKKNLTEAQLDYLRAKFKEKAKKLNDAS